VKCSLLFNNKKRITTMNGWIWLALGFVFIVVPEGIKASEVCYDCLYIVNPDGRLLLASRQRPQSRWVRKMRSCAGWIFSLTIFRKVRLCHTLACVYHPLL
jgi:hypothetical protein